MRDSSVLKANGSKEPSQTSSLKQTSNNLSKSDMKNLNFLYQNKQIDSFLSKAQTLMEEGFLFDSETQNKIQKLKEIVIKTDKHLAELNKKSTGKGWKITKSSNNSWLGIKIEGKTIEFKYEGDFKVDLLNVCVLFNEVGLYNNWMPFCIESEIARVVDPLNKTVFLKFKIPFLNERYLFFEAIGLDRIHSHNNIIVFIQGINISMPLTSNAVEILKFDPKKFDKNIQKNNPLILNSFIVEMTFGPNNTIKVKNYGKLTSRMAGSPNWLINYLMKEVSSAIMERVIKHANNFKGTAWEKEMLKKDKKPFYNWMGKRIDEWEKSPKPKL